MNLEKIADAISVFRRHAERALKRDPNYSGRRFSGLQDYIKNSPLNRSDAIRSFLTHPDTGVGPLKRHARNLKYEEYENTSRLPKNIVYRGEMGNTGAGNESVKYHDINKLQNKSKSHIYFTPSPRRALKSTDNGGIDENIKYTKVNENRTVSEDELANRRNPFFEHEKKFVDIRHSLLHDAKYKQSRKDEQYSYSQLKDLKQKQKDVETGKKLKDYKPNSFRSPEMFLNKNLHDIKTLKKHAFRDNRFAWKTEDGKTVMTKGTRLSDMFRPSN